MRGIILGMLLAAAVMAAPFEYSVARKRVLREEKGRLSVGDSGVEYESEDGKTSSRTALADIRKADLADPKIVRFQTYDRKLGQRREYAFRFTGEENREALVRFLVDRLKRPVIADYSFAGAARYRIRAYYRHGLGGAAGLVEIGEDGIRFVTPREGFSRTLGWRDIESVGSAGEFHFRVTTAAETFNFELKERLPEQAYEFAWHKTYR